VRVKASFGVSPLRTTRRNHPLDGKDDGRCSHDGRRIDEINLNLVRSSAMARSACGGSRSRDWRSGRWEWREIWDGRMLNGDEIETGNSASRS